ncbi:hypothetical protein PTKIN_Ptkin01aG0387900 [Pterospermum kingtungense]
MYFFTSARFFTSKFPICSHPAKPFLPKRSQQNHRSKKSSSFSNMLKNPRPSTSSSCLMAKTRNPSIPNSKLRRTKLRVVFLRAYLDKDKNVVYEADSDSVLTTGPAALLVNGLSVRPVQEVLRVSPDFALLLGLQQSLTPSRNNGFLNMLKLMQRKALESLIEAEKGSGSSGNDQVVNEGLVGASASEKPVENPILDSKVDENSWVGSSSLKDSEESGNGLGSRGIRIKKKLESELSPVSLEVEDVSCWTCWCERWLWGNSKEYEEKSLVKRQKSDL